MIAAAAPLSLFRPPFPPPGHMKVAPDEAVEVVGSLSLGMRRMAADIAFLRLLQYYGTRDD